MKRLRNIISLVAVCATAAFFTGCGEGDEANGGGNNNASNAPQQLNGKTYALTDAGPGGTISFDPAAMNYTLTQGGVTENGTFTATRSGDVWNATLVNAAGDTTSQLTMTFSGNGVGTYTYDHPGQPLATGSFTLTQSSGTSTSTGTDTGTTTNSGTNTGTTTNTGTDTGTTTNTGTDTGTTTNTGTDTGTTTNSGTNTGTSTSTGPGTGTVPAPATLQSITVTTAQSGIGPNSVYTVTFSGGQSGSFTARNTDNNVTGTGSYNYTPNGTQAHLHMNYNEFAGDFDDMTLIFTTQAGGGVNQFTGTQRVGGSDYTFTGTFTY